MNMEVVHPSLMLMLYGVQSLETRSCTLRQRPDLAAWSRWENGYLGFDWTS
jgi:hypothetical protein